LTTEAHPDLASLEWDTLYGKRKATLDIASAEGRSRFTELMKDCDVFSQAYRPGALAKLGFGPEQAMALRPGIVCVNLNAFGYTGEWKTRRGFDTVVQSACGMAWTAGRGKDPKLMPVSALDYIAGYLMTFGALTALKRRHIEGGSYVVNVSLARCAEWVISMGLHEPAVADAAHAEFDGIEKWLVEVPSPLGKLRRLRPIVNYSDAAMNELIAWPEATGTPLAWAR
jgi:crotonobetainyl-CoA:carnitine CoA-transferase CaiB-like acyl-CoA transferase